MFFNSFLLPEGLLFTTLLTPFFFINLLRGEGIKIYFGFLLANCIIMAIQLPTVEYLREYLKSFVLLQTVAVFTINAFYGIRKENDLAGVFKVLATVNMVLLGISLIALAIPVLRPWLWYRMSMSEGLPVIPRLKMLTYEASYYSLIIAPVFLYYFLKKSLLSGKTGILLITLTLSMLMSLSFGVLIALIFGLVIVFTFNSNELIRRVNLNYISAGIVIVVLFFAVCYWAFPHNIVFDRARNILAGKDTSARGRTTESFILAWNIAKMKSVYFGIGLGQLKMIGRDFIIQFYHYDIIPAATRIPNAVAETINIFGLVGLVLRFGTIVWLFWRTRVWENYYRLTLFIFIFIYQFTGSFLFNVAEYVVWILAFSRHLFPSFDRKNFSLKKENL
jgi:hypothetical protein